MKRSPERGKEGEGENEKEWIFPVFLNQVNPLILLIPVQTKKKDS
jgi:hypothetical protein